MDDPRTDARTTNVPLSGVRIVVTRPQNQAGALCDAFAAAGAVVVHLPAFRIGLVDNSPLPALLASGRRHDTVVFTSPSAVECFFEVTAGSGTIAGAEVAAVGPSTARALEARGVNVDVVAARHTAEGLLESLLAAHPGDAMHGRRVLYPRARDARDVLEHGLADAGAVVDAVVTYGTIAGELTPEQVADALAATPDVITFASPSAALHLEDILGAPALADAARRLRHDTVAACIGPVTADAVRNLGYRVEIVPDVHTAAGLLDAVVSYFQKER